MADCRTGKCEFPGCRTCNGWEKAVEWRLVHEPHAFPYEILQSHYKLHPELKIKADIYAKEQEILRLKAEIVDLKAKLK